MREHRPVQLLLVFAVTLALAVFASGIAHRSLLSTALLFLVAGYVCGRGGFDVVGVRAHDGVVIQLAALALYSVLFTDGMHAGIRDLRAAWRLPGRALLFGMPLTAAGAALLVHLFFGLTWTESFLVGAVLAPTDPVFAAAIVGRQEVPWRLRHLLNVESGLNDGLALPVVLVLLASVAGSTTSTGTVLWQLALGVALGVAVPVVVLLVGRVPALRVSVRYQPLEAFAIGVLVLALCQATDANQFLAAFAAGSTTASVSDAARRAFQEFGELVTELFKLAAVLVFGALLTSSMFSDKWLQVWGFALLLLFVVRPVSMVLSLMRGGLDRREFATVAWFGPKGFASVTYGLLVLQSDAVNAVQMFTLIAVATAVSMVLHSSSDHPIAQLFRD
jgi:NhaP-type Na+/H+ or K+/H+ antiporter